MALIARSRGYEPQKRISALSILAVLVDGGSWMRNNDALRTGSKAGCYLFGPGSHTINMKSSTACSGSWCPHCFVFDTGYGAIDLRIDNCDSGIHSEVLFISGVVNEFIFSNDDRDYVILRDGDPTLATTNEYLITPYGSRGSKLSCTCSTGGAGGGLMCDSSITSVNSLGTSLDYRFHNNCFTVNSASATLDYSTYSCQYKYCPTCIRLDTTLNVVTLTLSSCSSFSGVDFATSAIVYYHVQNTGDYEGYLSDGTTTFTLPSRTIGSGSFAACSCFEDKLSCSSLSSKLNAAPSPEPAIAYFPASLSVNNYLYLGHNGNTYAYYDSISSNSVEFYTSSTRTLTIGAGVGTLHGTWQADGAVGTSDSRLKKNIRHLQDTLRELQQSRLNKEEASKPAPSVGPAEWILSQLRPVSFSFISDKKDGRRFGFIAEEVEQIFPELIRVDEADSRRVKRVLMMDFIALLWMSLQTHQQLLEQIDRKSEDYRQTTEHRLSRLENDLSRLKIEAKHDVSRLEAEVKRLLNEVAECRNAAV